MKFFPILPIVKIIPFFLLIPFFGFGQSKFSFGVNAGAEISKLIIEDRAISSSIDQKGGIGFGYSLGLQTQYALNEKTFLRAGFNFQNQRYQQKITGLRFASDINLLDPMNTTESRIENNMDVSSISIPVDLGFRFKSKKNEKLNFLFGFGGIFHVNLDTDDEVTIFYGTGENELVMNPESSIDESIFSLGIFGGIETLLNEKLILGIEPNFRFTPHSFELYFFDSDAFALETGITFRISMR